MTDAFLLEHYHIFADTLKQRRHEYAVLSEAFGITNPIKIGHHSIAPVALFDSFNNYINQAINQEMQGVKRISPSQITQCYKNAVDQTLLHYRINPRGNISYTTDFLERLTRHIKDQKYSQIIDNNIVKLCNQQFARCLTELNPQNPISYDQYRSYQLLKTLGYDDEYYKNLKNSTDDLSTLTNNISQAKNNPTKSIDLKQAAAAVQNQIDLSLQDTKRSLSICEKRTSIFRDTLNNPLLQYGVERFQADPDDLIGRQLVSPDKNSTKYFAWLESFHNLKQALEMRNPKLFTSYAIGFNIIGQVGLGALVTEDPFVYHYLGHDHRDGIAPSRLIYEDPLLAQQNDTMLFLAGTAVMTAQRVVQTNPHLLAGTIFVIGAIHNGVVLLWNCALAHPMVAGCIVVGAIGLATVVYLCQGDQPQSYITDHDMRQWQSLHLRADYGNNAVAILPGSYGSTTTLYANTLTASQKAVAQQYAMPGVLCHTRPTRTNYDIQLVTLCSDQTPSQPKTFVVGYWQGDQFCQFNQAIATDYQDLCRYGQVKPDDLTSHLDGRIYHVLGVSPR